MLENWLATHNNHAQGRRTACVQVAEFGPGPLVCDHCRDDQTAEQIAHLPEVSRLLDALCHQLSTDADLDNVSRPDVYRQLCKDVRRSLEILDPTNPQV